MADPQIDGTESVLGVVYIAGSLAADHIADVVPTWASWSLMDTVRVAGETVMLGTILSLASLAAAWVIQDSASPLEGRGRVVVVSYAAATVIAALTPLSDVFAESMVAGIAHFLWGVAAYYYITYA